MQPVGSVSQCANAALNAAWLFVASPLFPPNEVSSSLGRCCPVAEAASVSTVLLLVVVLLVVLVVLVLVLCIAAATLCSVALSAALTVAGAQRSASAGLWSNSCAKMTSAFLRKVVNAPSVKFLIMLCLSRVSLQIGSFSQESWRKRAVSYLTDKILEATGARRAPCHR
jgi:hypothetical protein